MKILTLLGAAVSLCLSTVTMAASDKVEVCHIPPGNSANFHTITVSAKAVDAHMAHGDFEGGCEKYAEVLCDDGDMCTRDAFYAGTQTCETNLPVDCNDGNSCTTDSCDSAIGCVDTAANEGAACTDADSVAGTCSGGTCEPAATGCSPATLGDACDATTPVAPGTSCSGSLGVCVESTGCNDPNIQLPCDLFGYSGCCADGLSCHFNANCPGDTWFGG